MFINLNERSYCRERSSLHTCGGSTPAGACSTERGGAKWLLIASGTAPAEARGAIMPCACMYMACIYCLHERHDHDAS
jgi:hypothetical protein